MQETPHLGHLFRAPHLRSNDQSTYLSPKHDPDIPTLYNASNLPWLKLPYLSTTEHQTVIFITPRDPTRCIF